MLKGRGGLDGSVEGSFSGTGRILKAAARYHPTTELQFAQARTIHGPCLSYDRLGVEMDTLPADTNRHLPSGPEISNPLRPGASPGSTLRRPRALVRPRQIIERFLRPI